MATVEQLLQSKGRELWSIHPEATTYEALQLMAEKNVGAVVVVDAGNLAGILSERDYARKVALQGRTSKDTPVRDIMTAEVVTVSPSTPIEECMALFTDRRIRHLPVLEGDDLLGLISIGDVVKAIITDQKLVIDHLENYIRGH